MAFPNIYYNSSVRNVIGANDTPTDARCDYAACAGDQLYGWVPAFYGPDTLAQAKSLTQSNTWPTRSTAPTGRPAAPAGIRPRASATCGSKVKVCDITDGTSNTYMLGEQCIGTDYYYSGTSGADNEESYCGYDNDNHRTTFYPPMQDTPGFDDYYRFGSAHAPRLLHGLLRRLGADDHLLDRPGESTAAWATARTARQSTGRSCSGLLRRLRQSAIILRRSATRPLFPP